MKIPFFRSAIVITMAFCLTGCASFLTMMSPAQSEIVVGEKSIGNFNKFQYHYAVQADGILFTKTPMCSEVAQTYRKSQKKEIGYGPAMIEMPFFGLGLVDLVNANAISDNSKKEYPLAQFDTGNLLTCGKTEPAAGESVIIENPQQGLLKTAVTDHLGRLYLDSVLGDVPGRTLVTVYLKSHPHVRFSCFYRGQKLTERNTLPTDIYSN